MKSKIRISLEKERFIKFEGYYVSQLLVTWYLSKGYLAYTGAKPGAYRCGLSAF